jgi:two-component system, NarL family, response regulator LiaR
MLSRFLQKDKHIILHAIALALMLAFMKWLEYRYILASYSIEIYIAIIALLFMGLGIWLALKLSTPKVKTVIIEREVKVKDTSDFIIDISEMEKLGISKRELEVLELMALGNSNTEIAEKLFVSLSTIKTHASNLFEKLNVKRRTQAIEKARLLKLIP